MTPETHRLRVQLGLPITGPFKTNRRRRRIRIPRLSDHAETLLVISLCIALAAFFSLLFDS